MSAASRVAPAPQANLATYIERSLEFLWLLTAALVPLIFVPTDWMLSEAVNAYVEVPKTTGLRALVGLMTILWILEWVVKGGLGRGYNMARFPSRLRDWLVEQPSRWVVVAATFYLLVAMITTALSQARWISLWGEVSGQFGYSLYTTVSYFLLFAIISTHLKTSAQLWRLLGVIVATGALVALYGIVQHFNLDPLDLGESGYVRVASTMANSVFAGAFLVGSSLMTIGVGLMVLDKMGWTPVRAVLWVALVAAQLMAVYWTGARGSWVIGVPLGLFAFLVLAPFALGPRAFAENSLVRVLGLISILIVALVIFVYFVLDTILWGVPAGYLVFLVLSLFALGPLGFGSTRESLLVVASVLVTVFVLSLVLAVYLILETFLWQALLGSFVFLLLLGVNFQLVPSERRFW